MRRLICLLFFLFLTGSVQAQIINPGSSSGSSGISIGSTTITGGFSGQIIYDNSGIAGEIALGTSGYPLIGNGTSGAAAFGLLGVAGGGTGTSTAFTQGSVLFAGASGVYSQDNSNFNYNPTGFSSGPNFSVGPIGSSLDDATVEFYNATAGQYSLHIHNTGTQGSSATSGALMALIDEPSGAVISSGNQLGCLIYGGSGTTTQIPRFGAGICSTASDTFSLTDSSSNLVFQTVGASSTTRTTALTLTAAQNAIFAGNVGIGTSSPATAMQVIGTTTTTSATITELSTAGVLENNNSGAVSSSTNINKETIGITADGGSSAPATGVKGYFTIPYAGTITGWVMEGNVSGSAVFDIWKTNGAIPTVANTIISSGYPTLSSQQYATSTSLSGWSPLSVAVGDVFGYNLNSASTLTRVTLQLNIAKN